MKSTTRVKLVQKIYEKTNNPDGSIDFGKDPFVRHIKKVFKGYFEKNVELEQLLNDNLSDKLSIKNLDILLKIIIKSSIYELKYCNKIPFKVVIDQYLDVTDKFYGNDQKRLVNGVLDSAAKAIK
ncbi:MAG: nitrogen utilization protein B [Candidatus Pelagibacter sp.]|nr:nitrogen utilization protein B [Candidatus Pelagibacter sp.]OUV86584.1 MAG: nitrogen utilization protein B [Pelagibacteraceae bacterium TMED136]|tara:strand:+ start:728 stop:1102 length:375 start_codon:yes stop_codon:yes gene_type:complete